MSESEGSPTHAFPLLSPIKNDNSPTDVNNVIESGPTSLAYSGDNEEEYLRSTWQKLGVGHDGFLSLEELTKVCYAIGMEKAASEVIEQLFSRLDVDGDGRISFEEFLHMFQSGGPASHSFSLEDSINQENNVSTPSCLTSLANNSTSIYLSEFGGIFSTLDPEGTGFISVSRLVEIWFALGVSDGSRVLRDLGLPHRHGERIRVQDLSSALEEEWRPPQEQEGSPPSSQGASSTRHVAFLTLLHEIKGLRLSVESARAERDKYRWSLNEANHRLTLLAQELEENNAQFEASSQKQIQELEKCHRDQIRELQEALSRERDLVRDQASTESREILSINAHLQEEENRHKNRIATLEGDIRRLENENIDLNERLKESDHHLHIMDRQIVELKQLKCKVAEFESLSPREEEYRSLLQKAEMLATDNQRLRDENDELLSQLDSFSAKAAFGEKQEDRSLDGSCIGDYIDQSSGLLMGGIKRRGGTSNWGADGGEESSGAEDESPRGKKVKKCNNGKDLGIHYMEVSVYDESFDVSLPLQGAEKTTVASPGPHLTPYGGRLAPHNLSSGSPLHSPSQPRSLPLAYLQQMHSREKPAAGIGEASNAERDVENRIKEKHSILSHLEKEIQNLQSKRDRLLTQSSASSGSHAMDEMEFEDSSFKGNSFVKPSASTPLKQLHSPNDKCLQCVELENRLIVALEEAESALTQKDEEAREKMRLQALLQAYRRRSSGNEGAYDAPTPSEEDTTDCQLQQPDYASNSKVKMEALEEHCRGLEGELVKVRFEVIKMVEERERIEKENERLKNKLLKRTQGVSKTMKRRCRDLTEKLKRKRMALASSTGDIVGGCFFSPGGQLVPSRDAITTILEVEEPPEEADELLQETDQNGGVEDGRFSSLGDERRHSEGGAAVGKGGAKDLEDDDLGCCPPSPLEQEVDVLEREFSLYEEEMIRERDAIEKQKAALDERCGRLEQDLELSKSEFKKSEDYWLLKFKEEQDYYEEERKLYDENFSALEAKIREYEEVVLSTPGVPSEIVVSGMGNASEDSDRLSTIDESAIWEKQVTELEEEVHQLKIKIHEMQEDKELSLMKMEEKMAEEKEQLAGELSSLKQELEASKSLQKAYETQIVATKEELEMTRKIIDQKRMTYIQSMINGIDSAKENSPPNTDWTPPQKIDSDQEPDAAIPGNQILKYEMQISRLHGALKHNQKCFFETLFMTNKRHRAEVQSLETRIATTEQMFTSNLAKYKDQLAKATRTDNLVFELYLENAQLMKALELTEARQKQAEENIRKLELASLSSHSPV